MPKVSVIMCVYNGEKYLRQAIDSILNQSFKDFELITVDDASIDRTKDIIKEFCKKEIRIKLINNEKNIGRSASRNKAVKLAKGEYIAILDADDISLPKRLERQVKFLDSHKDIALVGSSFFIIDESGRIVCTKRTLTDINKIKKTLPHSNLFAHSTIMMTKRCLEIVGGYREELEGAEDYDLYLRLSEQFNLANLKEVLCKWRINPKSFSVARKKELDRYDELVKKLAKERKQFGKDSLQTSNKEKIENILINITSKTRNELSKGYYSWGRWLYLSGNNISALKFLIRTFPHNFFNKQIWFLILKSIIKLIIPKKVLVHLKKKSSNKC